MATFAIVIGGAVLNAVALIGGNAITRAISGDGDAMQKNCVVTKLSRLTKAVCQIHTQP